MAESKVKTEGSKQDKDKEAGGDKKKTFNFHKGQNRMHLPTTKFEGKVDALKGYYHDWSDSKQSEMFARTTTYQCGGDGKTAVESEEVPIFAMPEDIPEDAGRGAVRKWEKKIDSIATREEQLEYNLRQLFALIWGQCTEVLQQRIEAEEGFSKMSNENDGLLLLKTIKNVTYQHQSQKYVPHSLFEAKKRYFMQLQGKLPTADFHTQFLNSVAVIKHCGGNVWEDNGVEEMILRETGKTNKVGMTKAEMKVLAKDVEQRSLAVAFILCSDGLRFGKLVEDMENSYLQGNNKYPKTMVAANHLLAHWKHEARLGTRDVNGGEISFVNDGDKNWKDEGLKGCYMSSLQGKRALRQRVR